MSLATIIKAHIHMSGKLTGYELGKLITPKTGHLHQQIYRELSKLEKSGYLTKETIEQSCKPDKHLYSCSWGGDIFTNTNPSESNFKLSPVAYGLLVGDILTESNNFERYIDHMSKSEAEFFKQEG